MPDLIDGIPDISVSPEELRRLAPPTEPLYAPVSEFDPCRVRSAFGIALHMHQPTIPAGGSDLRTADLIGNLQFMMENRHIGDNHNAPVFLQCYSRMSDIVRELVAQGRHPRVMLDYSGNLLWGLRQMGEGAVLDNLARVTTDAAYHRHVEWLGTMWSHAVAGSTPVPDLFLQMAAWRRHFASLFGEEAVRRVKGFSPPEMHLPIHPDVCHAYVRALKDCGYRWLLVQEHTIEYPDGSGITRPHWPHRLVARNSRGEVAEIPILIKTQGSDTKLVAQMQPLAEAGTLGPEEFCGRRLFPYVVQIGDGENGGVMMNEFPPAYRRAFAEIGAEGVVAMNGSEYLEFILASGVAERDFPEVQPVSQHRIWALTERPGPEAVEAAVRRLHEQDPGFNLDRGSWTNDRDWVRGYEGVLDPIRRLSAAFHERFDGRPCDSRDPAYRRALLYLLLSQTSCFRYWGEGLWTDYAKELCRRGMEAVAHAG